MAYQYENVKLEKGMYGQNGRSFLKVLESLDPSENYKGTALEGLDAFQRQLKRFDIHVKGAGSDMVEKFFHTSESSVLFPEFVSRVVRQGMESDILPDITATVTNFDGMDYRSIASVPTDDDKELKRVEEGAGIPTTSIRTQENLVKLHKRGRMLVASYEAIRFQRLDLFSVTLRQIGAYIARMHLKDAIDVLMNGDGNNNAATSYTIGDDGIGGTKGTLSYDALLGFWSQFDPYTMNTMLMGSDMMLAMLKLSEFQNPLTGLNFQGTGTLATPLGAKLLRTSAMPAGKIIGLDKNYALERICGSEVLVEYDKLIDRQLERAAITSISGFASVSGGLEGAVLTVKSKEEERMAESMSEQIFSIACALSKADESEKSMLRMICTAQEESLVRALKEGVAKEDCESAFICAASWLAAAALESARAGGEEFSSLRAGDLTVTKRSSDEGSKRLSLLREQAWALMRPYTTDGGFCFRGVET